MGAGGVGDEGFEVVESFIVVVFFERGGWNVAAAVEAVDQYAFVPDGGDSEEMTGEITSVNGEIEAVSDEHKDTAEADWIS